MRPGDPNAPKVGERVRRGPDWKWGDQDGHAGNTGTVIRIDPDRWVEVRWDGVVYANCYRTPHCNERARDLTVLTDAPCSLVEAGQP